MLKKQNVYSPVFGRNGRLVRPWNADDMRKQRDIASRILREWSKHAELALDRKAVFSDARIWIDNESFLEVKGVRWAIEERRWTVWSLEEGLSLGEEADPRREFSAVLKESIPEYRLPKDIHFTFRSVKRKLFVDVSLLHTLTIGWPEAYLCEGYDVYVRGGEWEFVPGEFTWGKWWEALRKAAIVRMREMWYNSHKWGSKQGGGTMCDKEKKKYQWEPIYIGLWEDEIESECHDEAVKRIEAEKKEENK